MFWGQKEVKADSRQEQGSRVRDWDAAMGMREGQVRAGTPWA